MTSYTADEMYDRILASLQENSAYFARKARQERLAPLKKALWSCLIFSAGVVTGALAVWAL